MSGKALGPEIQDEEGYLIGHRIDGDDPFPKQVRVPIKDIGRLIQGIVASGAKPRYPEDLPGAKDPDEE
ncbi:hypothetical protein ACFL3T_03235 [Patescibacteria group bacterium]